MGAFLLPPNSRFRVCVPLSLDKVARQSHGVGFLFGVTMPKKEKDRYAFQEIPVPHDVRQLVFERDDFTCVYCGRNSGDIRLTIDHVTPITQGGGNDPSNLVTACADCNLDKWNRTIDEWDTYCQKRHGMGLVEYLRDMARRAIELYPHHYRGYKSKNE